MTLTPPHAIGWDEEPPHTLRDEGSPLTPNRMTFGAVTGGQRPEVPWVIPGWLTDRDRVFIVGPRKTGKSTLLLDLACSLATGERWLGFTVNGGPRRIVYVDEEQTAVLATQRIWDAARGRAWTDLQIEAVDRDLYYLHGNRLVLDNDTRMAMLEGVLAAHQAEWLLVDSLKRVHGRDENDNTAMSTWFTSVLDPMLARHNVGLVALHHPRKGDLHEDNLLDAARGASAITDWADGIWGYLPEGEDRKLFVAGSRWKSHAAPVTVRLVDGDGGGDRLEGVTVRAESDAVLDRLLDVVAPAAVPRTNMVKELIAKAGLTESAAAQAVKRYTRRGLQRRTLTTHKKGRDAFYAKADEGHTWDTMGDKKS